MDGRFLSLICLVILLPVTRAQDVQNTFAPETQPQLLVLVDGKVVKGQLTPRPDGYDVQLQAGRMFIESSRIRFACRDLEHAYEQMKSAHTLQTPEHHMDIAKWCLANQMPHNARREILDALRLDPNRTDGRRMLESILESESAPPAAARPRTSGVTEFAPGLYQPDPAEVKSLGGLSRPVAQEFTRHVQPLLMNKCASSGCHGGVENGRPFRLSNAHRSTSPLIAERNLASVLRQIDFERPAESPLLQALDGTHGNSATPLFRGRAGAVQMRTLRDWVNALVRDISPETASDSSAENLVARDSRVGIPPVTADEDAPAHGRFLSTEVTDRRMLQETRRSMAQDPFSPAVFNAKYHSDRPATVTRTSASPPDRPTSAESSYSAGDTE